MRGIAAFASSVFGSSARERRRRAREEAWKREEEIVETAEKNRGQAGDLDEAQWMNLVRGRDNGPR